MRCLITGGAGFIGSHLAEAVAHAGLHVTVLDDFSTGVFDNIAALSGADHVEIVDGSVQDAALIERLMAASDVCVHLASAVGVRMIVEQPLSSLQANVHGSDIVVSAAARQDTRLIYASTSEVYGKNSSASLGEDADRLLGSPFTARWGYAIAKSYGEALVHAHCREGLRGTVTRFFNTVGPRQTGAYGMVVPRFVDQSLAGEALTVYGDGTQTRCFIHVHDTVAALMLLLDEPGSYGRAFNIGRPCEHSILDLAQRVIERTGSSSPIALVPYACAFDDGFEELGRRVPDITAISELTGWTPRLTLDDAIDDAVATARVRSAQATR